MKITLKGITKAYNNEIIVENINMEVESGQLISILGSSGVGKTTILKIIAGLVKADKGRVYFDGVDVTDLPVEKRNIGYVFQAPLLFPHMTVLENIAFGLEVKGWDKNNIEARVTELVKLLKLEGLEERRPSTLSGGQQQRVAIARAIAADPKILLMDEPFSSLDSKLRQELGDLILELQQAYGLTIIFVTHDRNESLALSHEIALFIDGGIAQLGSPRDIYYRPNSRAVAEYMGACNFITGKVVDNCFHSELASIDGVKKLDGEVTLFIRPEELKIVKAGNGYRIKASRITGKEALYVLVKNTLELLVEAPAFEILANGTEVGVSLLSREHHFLT